MEESIIVASLVLAINAFLYVLLWNKLDHIISAMTDVHHNTQVLISRVTQVNATVADVRESLEVPEEPETSVDAEDLTEYELKVMQRDREFDERIIRLKEEVSNSTYAERKGTKAEELHPSVKNLPHNIINDGDNLPDVEYTY